MPHFPPLFPEVGGVGVTIDCCITCRQLSVWDCCVIWHLGLVTIIIIVKKYIHSCRTAFTISIFFQGVWSFEVWVFEVWCFEVWVFEVWPWGLKFRGLSFRDNGDHTFSNSLIIHEEKTKEITTVNEVWICDPNYHKIRRSFALIFSKNYQCFEKLYQTRGRVFPQISKHFAAG